MALLTENPPTPSDWASAGVAIPRPRRRLRGLALPVLPSWPLVAQVAGAVVAEVGVWQEWGRPVALIVGGVAAVAVGMLREAGRI
jgi:hypothetical protein